MAVSLQTSCPSNVHNAASWPVVQHVAVKSYYQYTTLSEGCIRLLVLLPRTPDTAVSCSLRMVNLSEFHDMTGIAATSELRAYEALSYVWGDPTNTTHVTCDDDALQITCSFGSLLGRVRFAKQDRILWADGVCINQRDLEERAQQVSLMGLDTGRPGRPGRYWLGWVKMMRKKSDGKHQVLLGSCASLVNSSGQTQNTAKRP
jgi:hypothetical protein